MRSAMRCLGALAVVMSSSCGGETPAGSDDGGTTGTVAATDETGTETDDGPPTAATVVHSFGIQTLAPREESVPCLQWTLENEQAVYVNATTLSNRGSYHHTNWFIVPEDVYPGPDGAFDCNERGFTEIGAATQGTVLTAQSTQSWHETMQLPEGVVVKVPARHKIIAGAHLLNLANTEIETELRIYLDIIHPRDVEVVATPIRFSYTDLDIPPMAESRFVAECDLDEPHRNRTGEPLSLKLFYLLPHYHYLGNYMDLTIRGGPDDGTNVLRLDGFDASANGMVFDPPVDLSGATGVEFTCGYDNWRDESVGWGIGDQEMCAILGLADTSILMDVSVLGGTQVVDVQDGIQIHTGPCGALTFLKNASQSPPTAEEIAGELYVPPTDPADEDLPPLDECVDTPADAVAAAAPTLTNVRETLIASSCTFSSCHDSTGPAAGLDLTAQDLRTVLTGPSNQSSLPLVTPGDPERSWLYQLLSRCEPADDSGTTRPHMPLNAPTLADPGMVALVRDWIAAGALDD